MRTIILHYHLFKNAGISLDQVLKHTFKDAWVTREFPGINRPEGNTPEVEAWIRDNPDAVAFSSHTMMGPLPKVEGVRVVSIMLLRDPIERIKSAYRFERTQKAENFGAILARHTDFEGYVKVRLALPHDRQCRNFQTQRLASLVPGPEPELDRARAALGQLTVVGLVADFGSALEKLASAVDDPFPQLRWKEVHANRSREDVADLPHDLDALLTEVNADDIALLVECAARHAREQELRGTVTRADPFLEETLEDLRAANVWQGTRALRAFQRDLGQGARLRIRAPSTGAVAEDSGHFYSPMSGCIYWFDAAEPFCLVSASTRLGCPILALVTRHAVYPVADPEPSPLIEQALAMLASDDRPERLIDPQARPMAFTGHVNFAHFVWNEFPGLWHLRETGAVFDVGVLHDPLGIMEAYADSRGLYCRFMPQRGAAKGWQGRPVLVPGATYCDAAVKRDILALTGLDSAYAPASDRPRIYFSLRRTGRAMQNELDFLETVVGKVLAAHPACNVVLDGFSLPVDFARSIYANAAPGFEARIGEARDTVAKLAARLGAGRHTRLHDITGVPLDVALREIARCHFYVTHAGTMQHKAGWFFPLPGLLHGNTASISAASLRWTASAMAGAVPPQGIAPDLVEDLEVCNMPRAIARNRDYRLLDVARAADDILHAFTRALGQTYSERG